ncbi:hypothetical protein GC102_31425 [Paenibacillus sp. LMG 31460]|uniref:Uncharacterized protein n=1 Tax=Paenibacillus germinis TaxID=2654979 RepID=A0ABX1ZAU4_9BACL|nr:hypothetical protein [Paenibacillus germinis]NOU90222.1 hypothetical protein [Paenibacillus germinis]
MIYTNATMVKQKWFEQAEREGPWQIPILFWRANQDNLILFESGSYIQATAVENNLGPPETLDTYHEQLRAIMEEKSRCIIQSLYQGIKNTATIIGN